MSHLSETQLNNKPSKVDRRQGTYVVPPNRYSTTPPVDPPGTTPQTYTLTQHNPDKGITIARTTVEVTDGWVLTTTTTLYRRHPDIPTQRFSGTGPSAAVPEGLTDMLTEPMIESGTAAAPPPTIFAPAAFAVPHPDEIVLRPGMEMHNRFYIIFRGREVGLFYDLIKSYSNTEVAPRISRVSHAACKVYSTFQAAVAAYTEAYANHMPGYELRVIPDPVYHGVPAPANATNGPNVALGLEMDIHSDSESESDAVEVQQQVQMS
ncbi:hypothetical protein VNI00_018516 [Paramarasmius palmivorus]|uniref:Uncharacterized protein n=1 Tax=Paramarasmius palmivorus TaxID=297713 RepID=A0AAW0AXE2_9AGAR